MAYFTCGFQIDSAARLRFDATFQEIVPDGVRSSRSQAGGDSAYVIRYGVDRAIPDVQISRSADGSWLVGVGTPLLGLRSAEQQQLYLSGFLADPADSLRRTIDGSFAIFSYDGPRNRFLVATDYNNTIPVFYTQTSEGLLFSSHELALARYTGREIDPFGFYQFTNMGATWGSHSRFRGIQKTLPCQVLVWDGTSHVRAECYWRPRDERLWEGSFDRLIEEWTEMLKESVGKFYECSGRKQAMADFTAGEDTRLIAATCHSLGIPFVAQVRGSSEDTDVVVAQRASSKVGFELKVTPRLWIAEELLLSEVGRICLISDGYQELTAACVDFATEREAPIDDYHNVKYCGVPGGEAFRGAYFLRGKAAWPSSRARLDYKFFTRMKFLLDHHPGLLRYPDSEGVDGIYRMARDSLTDLQDFPLGTQIDHMIRMFQTCALGLKYKNPLYLPLATRDLTRSIYIIPPRYKRGGTLTKACTEILYPELAVVRTQHGVPTVRRTLLRAPLFIPEHLSHARGIARGAVSRLYRFAQPKKWYYNPDRNMYILTALLRNPPYSSWLASSATMRTGSMYNQQVLDQVLAGGRAGDSRFLPVLGRIVSQELACRWVYRDGLE